MSRAVSLDATCVLVKFSDRIGPRTTEHRIFHFNLRRELSQQIIHTKLIFLSSYVSSVADLCFSLLGTAGTSLNEP